MQNSILVLLALELHFNHNEIISHIGKVNALNELPGWLD